MGRIRVNTDDLKAKAKDFETAANAFNTAGDDILATAMAMPSYDGQLSGPARAAGYEIQRQSREVQTLLSGDAQSLQKTAQAFEEVDNQAIDIFTQNQESLASYGSPAELTGIDQGNSYLGYRDDGLTDTVILCMYGECREVTRKGNETAIDLFEAAVNKYYLDKKARDAKDLEIKATIVIGTATIEGAGLATGGIGAVIAGIGVAIRFGILLKDINDIQVEMVKDSYTAAYYWNEMIGDKGLGPCVKGDDYQTVDDHKGEGDIYEP